MKADKSHMNTDKRKNAILITAVAAVFAAAAAAAAYLNIRNPSGEQSVTVSVDGKTEAVFSLDAEKTYTVRDAQTGEALNTVRISGGEVWMESASCPDKLCVKTGKSHSPAAPIICLPHRVEVRVAGADDTDAVSR